eukprot:2928170-Alexandrium_andersonii.AAC.1
MAQGCPGFLLLLREVLVVVTLEVLAGVPGFPRPGDGLAFALELSPVDAAVAVALLRSIASACQLDHLDGEGPVAAVPPSGAVGAPAPAIQH